MHLAIRYFSLDMVATSARKSRLAMRPWWEPQREFNGYRHYSTLHSQIGKVNALPSLFMCNRRGQPACDADFMLQGHTVPQIPTTSDMFWQDICNIKVTSHLASLAKSIIYVYLCHISSEDTKKGIKQPVMQNAACIVLSLAFIACHI